MHILSLIDDLGFGGDERRLLSFATTLDRRYRHTVMTIRAPDGSAESRAARAQFEAAGVALCDLGEGDAAAGPGPLHRRTLDVMARMARKVTALRRFVRERQVDLIDAHLESAGLVGALASRSLGIPCTVTLYSAHSAAYAARSLGHVWPIVGRFIAGTAGAVITDSRMRADELRRWAWPAAADVRMIPNGTAPPAAAFPPAAVKRRLGLPDQPGLRVIGQIGGLVPYKGYDVLLDAARLVLRQRSGVAFVLVGFERPGSGYADHLRRHASMLGIDDRVRVLSYPGPIGDIWHIVDVHAHATLFDSLPNAILEGMALGKPAVVTAVGGIPEAVEHEQSGLVVPPGRPDALAAALIRLLDDPATARRLGEAAHARYRASYRPEAMSRALEDLFASLVRQRRAA